MDESQNIKVLYYQTMKYSSSRKEARHKILHWAEVHLYEVSGPAKLSHGEGNKKCVPVGTKRKGRMKRLGRLEVEGHVFR